MKRSKAFVVAAIKMHRKRMLAAFESAKKHTKQLLQDRQERAMTNDGFLIAGRDFLKESILVAKKMYFDSIVWVGRLFGKNEHISVLVRNSWKRIGHSFSETYSKFVIRGEYTKRSLIVLFILAFSIGVAIKTIAVQSITIGFEDYTLAPRETLYDINLLQQKIIDRGDILSRNSVPKGGVCSESDSK